MNDRVAGRGGHGAGRTAGLERGSSGARGGSLAGRREGFTCSKGIEA